MKIYVVFCVPATTNSYVFCEPYVFWAGGAMSAGPVQGPAREVAQKALFAFAR